MSSQTSIDASEVGVHCSVCKTLDFLPFHCNQCHRYFCKTHAYIALPEQHECILDENKPLIKQEPLLTSTFKELLPDRSKRTQSELSPEETEKDKKKQAALTILHKNFPATIPLSQNASSSKPVKALSKATMLIKLKQRAKAGDTGRAERQILPKHRRYLLASVFRSEKCIEVWLPDVGEVAGPCQVWELIPQNRTQHVAKHLTYWPTCLVCQTGTI